MMPQQNNFLYEKLLGPAEPALFSKSANKQFIKPEELTDVLGKHGFCTVA